MVMQNSTFLKQNLVFILINLWCNKPRNSTKMTLYYHIAFNKDREEKKEAKRGKSKPIGWNEWKVRGRADRRRCYHILEPLIANVTLPPV